MTKEVLGQSLGNQAHLEKEREVKEVEVRAWEGLVESFFQLSHCCLVSLVQAIPSVSIIYHLNSLRYVLIVCLSLNPQRKREMENWETALFGEALFAQD